MTRFLSFVAFCFLNVPCQGLFTERGGGKTFFFEPTKKEVGGLCSVPKSASDGCCSSPGDQAFLSPELRAGQPALPLPRGGRRQGVRVVGACPYKMVSRIGSMAGRAVVRVCSGGYMVKNRGAKISFRLKSVPYYIGFLRHHVRARALQNVACVRTKIHWLPQYNKERNGRRPSLVTSAGDLGYYDEYGWLFLYDRIKLVIHCSGGRVSPHEMEDHLVSHPKVSDAAVLGIPRADSKEASGHGPEPEEVLAALVVVRKGHRSDKELAAELISYTAGKYTHTIR
ncbi:hypothetical protein HPB48_013807 [Haemaphysalis longicornis]|uniref:AMP-binding enzyme C-terminal domain-containing protein n=1 Tax=Haemaphysalis longicornis TaxID=44386 RepID=A0A9J6FBF8_HAELO|nr:hypothetical protein HPB48_013807 [Haemaphysalis longicornis]